MNERIRRWNTPRPVPLNALQPGTVVWADIPFADGTGTKGRPAVVLYASGATVTVLPVTSAPARTRRPRIHVELSGWAEAGMTRPSAVRLRTVTVPRLAVTEVMGQLVDDDREIVLPADADAA